MFFLRLFRVIFKVHLKVQYIGKCLAHWTVNSTKKCKLNVTFKKIKATQSSHLVICVLNITVYIEMYSTVYNVPYSKVYSIVLGMVHEFITTNKRWQEGRYSSEKFQLWSHLDVKVQFVVY